MTYSSSSLLKYRLAVHRLSSPCSIIVSSSSSSDPFASVFPIMKESIDCARRHLASWTPFCSIRGVDALRNFLTARPSALQRNVWTCDRLLSRVGRRVVEWNKETEAISTGTHGAPGSSEGNGRESREGSQWRDAVRVLQQIRGNCYSGRFNKSYQRDGTALGVDRHIPQVSRLSKD